MSLRLMSLTMMSLMLMLLTILAFFASHLSSIPKFYTRVGIARSVVPQWPHGQGVLYLVQKISKIKMVQTTIKTTRNQPTQQQHCLYLHNIFRQPGLFDNYYDYHPHLFSQKRLQLTSSIWELHDTTIPLSCRPFLIGSVTGYLVVPVHELLLGYLHQ